VASIEPRREPIESTPAIRHPGFRRDDGKNLLNSAAACSKSTMRAEIANLVDEMQQSIALLRRHL